MTENQKKALNLEQIQLLKEAILEQMVEQNEIFLNLADDLAIINLRREIENANQ